MTSQNNSRLIRKGTSVIEFFERFPNERACLDHIHGVRWGDHTPCPRCRRHGRWFWIGGTKKYQHACRRQPESGVWQVFFFDPNGARVELDFAAGEPGPPDAQ